MNNLTETQKATILQLSKSGLSQNQIAERTRISKPYVNMVLKEAVLAGIEEPKIEIGYTHHSQPVSSSAELHYTKMRLDDVERANRNLLEELQRTKGDLVTLQTKYSQLDVEHRAIEAKHQYEKDNILAQHKFTQTNSLSGLTDKVLNNDKLVNGLLTFLMHKAGGTPAEPQQTTQTLPQVNHPLAGDPKVATEVKEIYQVLAMFNAEQISNLHMLIGAFVQYPDMIKVTTEKLVEYVTKKQATPQTN